MFGSDILDVAIGVVFVYFILSLIASIVTEFIGNMLMKLRAKTLKEGISILLSDKNRSNFAKAFYDHPLIQSLSNHVEPLPSTIEAGTFATVVLDLIITANGAVDVEKVDDLINMVQTTPSGLMSDALKTQLIAILRGVKRVDDAKIKIQEWYDSQMARVSGWYKRQVQSITVVVAIVIVFLSNADTIMIFNSLSQDPTARQALVAAAENITANPPDQLSPTMTDPISGTATDIQTDFQQTVSDIDVLTKELGEFSVLGWSNDPASERAFPWISDSVDWLSKLVGLLLTAGAVSLGAPFWFNLLSKIVDLRTGGKTSSHAETPVVDIENVKTEVDVEVDKTA